MEIIPFPRVAFGTPFAKPFSGDGGETMYLSQEETLDGHTSAWKEGRMEITKLYGNTDDQARGVGDEVVQILTDTIIENSSSRNGVDYVKNGGLSISVKGMATAQSDFNIVNNPQQITGLKGHTLLIMCRVPYVLGNGFLRFSDGVHADDFGNRNYLLFSVSPNATTFRLFLRVNNGVVLDYTSVFNIVDLTASATKFADVSTPDEFAHRLGFADASKLPVFPYGSSYSAKVTATPPSRNLWDEEWENKYISISGVEYVDNTTICTKNLIAVERGKTYYFKKGLGKPMRINYYDANKVFLRQVAKISTASDGGTFTPDADAVYFGFFVQNTPTYNHDICVNLSDADNGKYTPYIPPKDYPVLLNAPLHKINNLVDYADRKEEVHYLGVYTFTGNENWMRLESDSSHYRFLCGITTINMGGSLTTTNCKSDIYEGAAYQGGTLSALVDKRISTESRGNITVVDYGYNTVEEFRNHIKGHKIVYMLATPVKTKPICLPKIAFPVTLDTLVTVDSEVKPSMDVRYYAKEKLSLLADQPPYLYGEGAPSANIIPRLWKQFDIHTWDGYNWNGEPSAIGQKYINTLNGDTYIAVASGYYGLTWQKQ